MLLGENEISCKQASDKGYHHLQEAEEMMVGQGVDTSKIVTMLLFGRPGATLASHAGSSVRPCSLLDGATD